MRIWVDADACPGPVKDIIIRAAERTGRHAVFVSNQNMRPLRSKFASSVKVPAGFDVADSHIVSESAAGDLCITADIPLAALLVPKGVVVIDPRGEVFTAANVGERLSVRDFMHVMREAGMVSGGPRSPDQKDKQRFASALDAALAKAR